MKLRSTPSGLVARHTDGTWRAVPGDDLLWFLTVQRTVRVEVAQRLGRAEIVDEPAAVPFLPRAFRVVSPWSPALRPPGDDASPEVGPALACVLTRPLWRATPGEAVDAIGGWLVLGPAHPTGAVPTQIAGATAGRRATDRPRGATMGEDVITADELPDWTAARGRVLVDGDVWCEGSTAGPAHALGALLAHASSVQPLTAGDVVSTGAMPGCRRQDHGRRIPDGGTVELEIDGIGRLTHRLAGRGVGAVASARGRTPEELPPIARDRHLSTPAARFPSRPLGG